MVKGGLGNLMKQAQRMQAEVEKAQKELAELEVQGQSGGGMVTVTMTGKHDVRRVDISPEVMDDREMLEALVAVAVNDAVRRVETESQSKLSGLTAGINLPPGIKLPF